MRIEKKKERERDMIAIIIKRVGGNKEKERKRSPLLFKYENFLYFPLIKQKTIQTEL